MNPKEFMAMNDEETKSAITLIEELLKKRPCERDYCPLCQRVIYGATGIKFVKWPERLKELRDTSQGN